MKLRMTVPVLMFCAALPASAQTAQPAPAAAAQPAVGASVYGSDGALIGTVERISGQNAILAVGNFRVPVPFDRFGKSDKGLSLAMTRTQFDTMLNQAQNQAAEAIRPMLKPDAEVYGTRGNLLGKITAVSDDTVTVTSSSGIVNLPVASFTAKDGKLGVNLTNAEIEAAAAASQPAKDPAPAN